MSLIELPDGTTAVNTTSPGAGLTGVDLVVLYRLATSHGCKALFRIRTLSILPLK
ncbi:MAG: hypothetical protein H3C45_12250 [Bacteroidia bacterium]|nr:hypothetical protein [Bacteroidia bacterium]